jgi:hypothetical protein
MKATARAFDSFRSRKSRLPEPEPEQYSQHTIRTAVPEPDSTGVSGWCTSHPAPRREASCESTQSGCEADSSEVAASSQIGAP